ncbi:MAG: hypothetical protein Q9170_006491 [Blastenia crenularia]
MVDVDEREPACGQCIRLNRPCPGIQGTTLFVDETARFESGRGSSEGRSLSKSRSKSPNPSPSSEDAGSIPDLGTLIDAQDEPFGEPLYATRWHLDLPVEVYQKSLLVNKLRIHEKLGFAWLRWGLNDKPGEPGLPQLFTRDLAQAYFGQHHHLPEVTLNAQVSYGRHLLSLKKELSLPGSIDDPDLFLGIMTAVMYEFVAMTSPDAWRTHVYALARILESRGPQAYQYMPDKAGFGWARALVIGVATQRRKRTFLEEPRWKITGPWLLPNTLQDQLTDVQYVSISNFTNMAATD